ncbi:hypothetical protein G7070_06190 [Propioniciclava coleopterorum]|uniref:DUF5808 domain-containing protein n=1 Tax=Propioniciclava coleopterorum TaxID=2714937 RepID=A0A6G7Y2L2_9ACTN|nr:DUF5808 domain-containing protein [Propioniciclava coleopterorum]QIK70949.1 hypothetical protein G7070_06190 [Propioniciclava coleopterorum]
MIRSIDELTPETAAAARSWLEASVAQVPASYRGVVRDEMMSSMCAAMDADMTPEQFAGAVERIAAFVVEDDDDGADGAPEAGRDPRVGRWCGIPYDFRPPTGERIRQSMWNPADPRLLMPRAFGAGWDLNVGAVAVRLGFIEPDAEDEPFAEVPQGASRSPRGCPSPSPEPSWRITPSAGARCPSAWPTTGVPPASRTPGSRAARPPAPTWLSRSAPRRSPRRRCARRVRAPNAPAGSRWPAWPAGPPPP